MSKVNNANKIIEVMHGINKSDIPEGFTGAIKVFTSIFATSKTTGRTYRKKVLQVVQVYKDGKLHCENGPAVFYGKAYLQDIESEVEFNKKNYTDEQITYKYYPGFPPSIPNNLYYLNGVNVEPFTN